jgi:hypothetical protein
MDSIPSRRFAQYASIIRARQMRSHADDGDVVLTHFMGVRSIRHGACYPQSN